MATKLALLFALAALLAAPAVAGRGGLRLGSDDCTVNVSVIVDPEYTFNYDAYVFVYPYYEFFNTCNQSTTFQWTIGDDYTTYGSYVYEYPETFNPGQYASSLTVLGDDDSALATYNFTLTILNSTQQPYTDAPYTDAPYECTPSATVILEPSYVFGNEDYAYISGDFSYFDSCYQSVSLTWTVTDGSFSYNTTGYDFYAYPQDLPVGNYAGELFVSIGDFVNSTTTFNLTIVNGSVPTNTPQPYPYPTYAPEPCEPSPIVLLDQDYTFGDDSDVYIYGDYSYFQTCYESANLVWTVGGLNSTGYAFYAPVDSFAIGSYSGTLQVFLGDADNETLASSYEFTVTIVNGSAPTDAPETWAPETWAPYTEAPCQPDYSVFLSDEYSFYTTEDVVIYPDLDYFTTCGADFDLNWTVGSESALGTSFFEPAGTFGVGEYAGQLVVVVSGTEVETLYFNMSVYDDGKTALKLSASAVAQKARAKAAAKLADVKKKAALLKKRPAAHRRAMATTMTTKKHGGACSSRVGLPIKLETTTHSALKIVPSLAHLRACGSMGGKQHLTLVYRVGSAMGTGRKFVMKPGAFAAGVYTASVEVFGRGRKALSKTTFLVVVKADSPSASATTPRFRPLAKMQKKLESAIATSSKTQSATTTNAKSNSPSKAVVIGAAAACVALLSVVVVAAMKVFKRQPSEERQHLVVNAAA